MNYSLLKYEESKICFNLGDNIQSIAAKQFLPSVYSLLKREKLSEYTGNKTKLIMNGWFTQNAHNWIPSNDILPLYVSFHINSSVARYMLSKKGIAHLKQHEPIGCRDHFTVNILKEKGIEAYFTGCLTLTLDSYKVNDSLRTEDIYIVDPLFTCPDFGREFYSRVIGSYKGVVKNILNGDIFQLNKKNQLINCLIDKDLLTSAKFVKHELPVNTFLDEQKFILAEDLLHRYAKAKLVITSRIHCALPCLAMGTPVIFINGFSSFIDSCRFEGILDLFNRIDVDIKTGKFTANFSLNGKINEDTMVKNLEKHFALIEPMKEKCRAFVES